MTERQIVQKITKYVKDNYKDIFWYKIPDIPRATTKKPFDVVGCYKGKAFAIEFKKPKGKLEAHQAENLELFMVSGGHVSVTILRDDMKENYQLVDDFLQIILTRGR